MCNFYNTSNASGYSGCGYSSYNSSCGCNSCCNRNGSFWGWGGQSICRDCNGNIRVNQRNSCGCGCHRRHCCCHNGCGCQNGCGGSNNTGNSTNGNGGFTCVTFCGNSNTSTTTGNVDLYYARQYGLYPYGYNRSCGCTLDAVSEL